MRAYHDLAQLEKPTDFACMSAKEKIKVGLAYACFKNSLKFHTGLKAMSFTTYCQTLLMLVEEHTFPAKSQKIAALP